MPRSVAWTTGRVVPSTKMGKAGGMEVLGASWEFSFGYADLDSKWSQLVGSCMSQGLQGKFQLGINVWEPSISDIQESYPQQPSALL